MKLKDLIGKIVNKDKKGVPNWMLGYFKRNIISFYNGQSDNTTDVCWFQSRTFTIDLRLPKNKIAKKEFTKYSKDELEQIANYEGWVADSIYDGEKLFWQGGVSYQNRNKWPEPAYLKKIGNCMMEFCPSNVYVEDWRLQNDKIGYQVGLELIEEINLSTNELIRESGGLIISGEYAALCLGREKSIDEKYNSMDCTLEDILLDDSKDIEFKKELLTFETSVAKGNMENGYEIYLSTNPNRYDEEIISLDGYELSEDKEHIIQYFIKEGKEYKRVYKIDMIDNNFVFEFSTDTTKNSKQWFKKEQKTLGRYLNKLK